MKLRTITALFCFMIVTSLSAQQLETPNLKFGKPTKEELSMTRYDKDPEASAVVLYENGDLSYELEGYYSGVIIQRYNYQYRVKILKEQGTKYANFTIPYIQDEMNHNLQEEITGIKLITYNEENGKLVKTKLADNQIFRERKDKKHYLLKITAPQAKVGSVIELQYEKTSHIFWQIDDYYAQRDIPVAHCNYKMEIPTLFYFNVERTIKPYFDGTVTAGSLSVQVSGNSISPTKMNCKLNIYSFVGKDIPALKNDKYIWAPEDYAAKVVTELQTVQWANRPPEHISKSWEDVDDDLLHMDGFAGRLNDGCKFKDELLASGIDKITDFKEKVSTAYTYLMNKLSWDGKYKIMPGSANSVLKKGSGSNADLNMIFISMCNTLGITAYPVIMSSRDNGKLPQNFPSFYRFNTFVVAVTDGTETYYLDASGSKGYLNVLPARLYVDKARTVRKGKKGEFINLQNFAKGKEQIFIEAELSKDGILKGTCSNRFSGNAASDKRMEFFNAKDSAEYVSQLANKGNLSITKYETKGYKQFVPDVEEKFEFTKKVDITGDNLYLNAFIFSAPLGENPFKMPTRDMPVEFGYKNEKSVVVNIKLPEGYTLEEGPKNTTVRTEDSSISGKIITTSAGNMVTVIYKFQNNKLVYNQDQYTALKNLFDRFENASNSVLIIKKN